MNKMFKYPGVSQVSFPAVASHTFYIHGPIEEIFEYRSVIATLDNCQENDLVNLFINTPGGCLNTTISILHAMMRCKGTIITHADGQIASAGTLLFLAGTHKIVYPYSYFLFHDGSMGNMGKINESLKNISATSELLEQMAYAIYKPYFSEEEIDDILEGRDYHCTSEEMYDRIEKGIEILSQQEDPLKELKEATEEPEEKDILRGDTVRVDNARLASNGQFGEVIGFTANGVPKVKLDSGLIVTIKEDNLTLIEYEEV